MSSKIRRLIKIIKKINQIVYLYLHLKMLHGYLNIRGKDNPNSPIPNCRLIIDKNKKIIFLVIKKNI